jgi:hypothetical protein
MPQLSGNFGVQQTHLTVRRGGARPAVVMGHYRVIFGLSPARDTGHDFR